MESGAEVPAGAAPRPPQFTLRPAEPDDAPQLRRIVVAAFAQYEGRLDPPSGALAESEDSLRAKVVDGGAWLCLQGDESIGCAFFAPRADHLYLGRLAVLPAWRGRGVGELLLERVEAVAREQGLVSVQLGVRLALTGLRAWYEARGYTLLEERSHAGYAWPTIAQLIKRLPPACG
jgi:GNAT superfamily N-acetyltransferase